MDLASIFFGFFLAVFAFTQVKVVNQTRVIWWHKRSLRNAYLVMIWVEAWVNFVFALITFLFLNDLIPGSLGFYIITVLLWAIQTQLLLQIVANRVALIMVEPRKAMKLKWALFLSVLAINIAVAVIWISAQMPGVSEFQITLNHMFEKAEKSFFLVVDLGLNLYFLYLVRYRLIQDGLSKYWTLFYFNTGMVALSASMDCLLLGFLSLPDTYIYVQFAPVAYIVKLYIELSNASLIAKVVRSGSKRPHIGMDASTSRKTNMESGAINPMTSRAVVTSPAPQKNKRESGVWGDPEAARGGSSGSEAALSPFSHATDGKAGIMRTVETVVVVDADNESDKGRKADYMDL